MFVACCSINRDSYIFGDVALGDDDLLWRAEDVVDGGGVDLHVLLVEGRLDNVGGVGAGTEDLLHVQVVTRSVASL